MDKSSTSAFVRTSESIQIDGKIENMKNPVFFFGVDIYLHLLKAQVHISLFTSIQDPAIRI